MKRITNFIVEKRTFVLAVFLLLTLCSAWLMTRVNVNHDMTKYLPDNSSTKIGKEIMDSEFPITSSFSIMFKGLSEGDKAEIYGALVNIESVETVSYEAGDENYNKDDYTLYTITIGFDAYSPEARTVVDTVNKQFSAYDISLYGDAAANNAIDILPKIAGTALVILLIILFLMCNSWIEPLLFLITIVIAIVINMGTNAVFESVSDITQSIAAILQLVLSMDYSIMLINRYRQEKQGTENKSEAMKNALHHSFTAISSSSVTTIVGMLALVFMSFTIGRDLGLVLAKGVLLSLICIFTVLPALILAFDRVIEKTAKKSLQIKMDKLGSFSYRARYGISVIFVLLFIGSFFLKGNVSISYTTANYYKINEIFKLNNPIVVLYENKDEEKIAALAEKWSENAYVDSINAYSTTLGKELSCGELADAADLDETLVALMYKAYFGEAGEEKRIALGDFIEFLKNDVATNELFAPFFDEDTLTKLNAIGGESAAQPRVSSEEFAAYSNMDGTVVQQIFGYYFSMNGQTEDGKIALDDLTQFLMTEIATNAQFAPLFTEDILAQLNAMGSGMDSMNMEQELSSEELAAYINMDEAIVEQLYSYYAIVHGEVPEGKIALYDFMQFVIDEVAVNEQFTPYFTEDILTQLDEAKAEMDDGLKQLVGDKYARLIINTSLAEESDETFSLIGNLEQELRALNGDHYIVGSSAMAYEMNNSFPSEMNFITILTAVAIFIVVAIAFRSLSIPFILVCVIQCAVFITMGTVYIQGSSIYYLPLLIVQCLLMGATIDYGILYTSYYLEARKVSGKKEAVVAALNHAIHTILTSALILIVVTSVLGVVMADSQQAISEILLTIAKGGFCSTMLVVFILPSLLCALDKFVVKKNNSNKPKDPDLH